MSQLFRVLAGFGLLLAFFLPMACHINNEGGEATLSIDADTSLLGHDRVVVLLRDATGRTDTLFDAKLTGLDTLSSLPARRYDGGKAVIILQGLRSGQLVYEERRQYDGTTGKLVAPPYIIDINRPGTSGSLDLRPAAVRIFAGGGGVRMEVHPPEAWKDKPLAWTTGDSAVAKVSPAGMLTPVGLGNTYVRATFGDSVWDASAVWVVRDPPILDVGAADTAVRVGSTVAFQVRVTQEYGGVASFAWDLDGDGTFEDSAAGVPGQDLFFTSPKVYAAGDFQARFRARDGEGNVASATKRVRVTASAPRIDSLKATAAVVSIQDSVAFSAVAAADGGTLRSYAWDFDGDGEDDAAGDLTGASAPVRGGFRYLTPETFKAMLRVTDAAGASVSATVEVTVQLDRPNADAGPDVTAPTDTPLTLAGTAKDGLGTIVKREWSVAGGAFAETPDGKVAYSTPSAPGKVEAIFRVSDDDGLIAVDTAVIHVISPVVAALTQAAISGCALSPPFNPDSLAYACAVPHGTAAVTATAQAQGSMTLNGKPLADGAASDPIALAAGKATLTLTVARGSASRTYTVNVSAAAASGNNALGALVLSAGTLSPAFSPDSTAYAATVASSVASITVKATLEDTKASLSIASAPAVSDQPSAPIALGEGAKVIPIVVTAQNGQVRSYSVSVTRQTGNTNLKSLAVSAGALAPAFAAGTLSYTVNVGQSATSLRVTASPEDTKASMTLNGSPLAANTAASVALAQTGTIVNLVVRADDSAITKTYVIKVIKVDDVPPNAPTVVLGAWSSPDRPGWTWTSGGGGNGSFRYTLDDSNLTTGATSITASGFTPAADLAPGTHIVYVQERDSAGNWSPSGKAAAVIGGLKGVADYPLAGHASDTLWRNADATVAQAPYLAQGVYLNGISIGSGDANLSGALTPRLAGFDTTAFTAEVDFLPDGIPDDDRTVIMGGTLYRWLGATLDPDGKVSLHANNLSNNAKGTQTCTAGQWHTLRLEYAGGSARLYLNGTLSASLTMALSFGGPMRGDYTFGTNNNATNSTFKGNWRNLRVHAGTAKIAQYPLAGDTRDITGKQEAFKLTNAPFQLPEPGATLSGVYPVSDISTPILAGLDMADFRITAEFSIAALPVAHMPVVMGSRTNRWLGARIESDGGLTLVYNNSGLKATAIKVSLADKHKVEVRYSAASAVASIYLDGALAGSQSVPTLDHGDDKVVTATNWSNGTAFKGTLYRIRVDGK